MNKWLIALKAEQVHSTYKIVLGLGSCTGPKMISSPELVIILGLYRANELNGRCNRDR